MKQTPNYLLFAIPMFLGICTSALASLSDTRPSSGTLTAEQRHKILELSNEEYWHRLMHYKKSFPFYKTKSEVDGAGFFFSPEGKTSPSLEMLATSEAFFKDTLVGKLKQHAQCAFPERYKYLKSSLQLGSTDVKCTELEKHMAILDPESVALGFSSSYTGNPGSMFGHTFLKINSGPRSTDGKKRMDLLDWGIGFAAGVPPDTGGLEFAWNGIVGGFQSQFSLMPYYQKVNEYVNAESRDIWEYELSLNKEETVRLVNHFWEVETNSHFDYFFFDENCSYQLMTALEVARPDWKISSFGPHVIPAETVKRLLEVPGAVRDVKYRPSLKRKTIERYSFLTETEKSKFDEILSGDAKPSQEDSSTLLEALSTFLQFRKQLNSGEHTPKESLALRLTLIERSLRGVHPPPQRYAGMIPPQFVETRPEIGHDPYVIGTSSGLSAHGQNKLSAQYFQELQFKFAYHDLLNNDMGYGRYSHIDFPNITLRYYSVDQRIAVEKVTALALTSITPFSLFEKKMSFGFAVRYYEPKDLDCRECGAAQVEGAVGLALPIVTERNVFYGLLWGYIDAGSGFGNAVRLGPKPSLGLLLNPWEPYKTQIVASAVFDVFQSKRQGYFIQTEWNQSFSFSKSWEMRSGVLLVLPSIGDAQQYREMRITLNHFF